MPAKIICFLSAYHKPYNNPVSTMPCLERDKAHGIVGSLNDSGDCVSYDGGPGVAYGLNMIGEGYITRYANPIFLNFCSFFFSFWFCGSFTIYGPACPAKSLSEWSKSPGTYHQV